MDAAADMAGSRGVPGGSRGERGGWMGVGGFKYFDLVQGGLTTVNAAMSSSWRQELRSWFKEDTGWRGEDVAFREEEKVARTEQRLHRIKLERWRTEEIDQRNLENARVLWLRFVEKNRRDVEEKSEQLKALSSVAAMFALSAVVTLSQLNALLALYALLTAVVEGLMTVSVVVCALMLGSILRVGKTYVSEEAEAEFMSACAQFCSGYRPGDRPPQPRKAFQAFWDTRCEKEWQMAFNCCCWGMSSFILSLIGVGYIAFTDNTSRLSFIVIIVITLTAWMGVHFSWHSFVQNKPSPDVHVSGRSAGLLPHDWHAAPHWSLETDIAC